MRKLFLAMVLLLITTIIFAQKQWQKGGIKIPAPVCYGSNKVSRTYVEPPYELLNRLKSTGQQNANIIVKYDAEFEADTKAKAVFEAAVKIWEGLVSSSVPIYVYAYWDELDENVLGSCFPWDFYENLDFMPQKDTYYPGTLVEKMLGEEITDASTPDIVAHFNKNNTSWYLGSDGKTPTNKYDFMSVVLHEIGHGLGYLGLAQGDTSKQVGGYEYIKRFPGVFDRYTINRKNQNLVDTSLFKNPSSELYDQFVSGYLLFNKKLPFDDSGFLAFPRLYAPSKWDDGSSISHLDENTYDAGTSNSLMTPSFDLAEAIHTPGSLSLEMLYEMGWKFIQIKHEELFDIEKIEDLKKVEVYINSDYELDSTRLYLISSSNEFVNADTVLLSPTAKGNLLQASLPVTKPGTIKYYLSAANAEKREFKMPGIAPQKTYSVTFGNDNTAPVVTHHPVSFMKAEDLSAGLVVNASDNLGVNAVHVEYIVNKTAPSILTLPLDSANIYKAILSFSKGSLVDGDSVRYRVIVEDKSVNKNTSMLPVDGYYTIYIQGIYDPVKEYFTDFNTSKRDFISSDFKTATPTGFANGALHSLHPYLSPEKDNMSYNYVAQLKYPIIIKNGGIITFDEVVLVEPGEPGAVFGSDNFFDYVIVEGSKNNGKTWLPLIDGYDSGSYGKWEVAYNKGFSGNNSTSVGSKSLFLKREFLLNEKGNFAVGDTILIQFRLYSDPFANGWGWCIDNLNIQDPKTAVASMDYSPAELIFYPNPVTDKLTVQGNFTRNADRLKLSVYNNSGQLIWYEQIDIFGNSFRKNIDMNNFAPGLYLIAVDFGNGQRISEKIIKK